MRKILSFLKKHGVFIAICAAIVTWGIISYVNEGAMHALVQNDAARMVDYIGSFGALSYVIFILLVIAEVVLAPVPPLILYTVAGMLYGSLWGGVLVLFGNLIGASIDFFIGRKLSGGRIREKIDPKLWDRYQRFSKRYGSLTVFVLRVNPLTSSDMVSYIAGFSDMKPHVFLIATAAGLTPLIFAQSYLGGDVIRGNDVLVGITFVFSALYLLVFAYLIYLAFFNGKSRKGDAASGGDGNSAAG